MKYTFKHAVAAEGCGWGSSKPDSRIRLSVVVAEKTCSRHSQGVEVLVPRSLIRSRFCSYSYTDIHVVCAGAASHVEKNSRRKRSYIVSIMGSINGARSAGSKKSAHITERECTRPSLYCDHSRATPYPPPRLTQPVSRTPLVTILPSYQLH